MRFKLGIIIVAAGLLSLFYFKEEIFPSTKEACNTHCPITGKPVNGRDQYVYKGVRHNLCSPACEDSFAEEPDEESDKESDKETSEKP